MTFYDSIAAAVALNSITTIILIIRGRKKEQDRVANTVITLTWAAITICLIMEAIK